MLPYDSHWPPGQISYPPLPPPTPDETSFLNELASIGEQWPVIMQEVSRLLPTQKLYLELIRPFLNRFHEQRSLRVQVSPCFHFSG